MNPHNKGVAAPTWMLAGRLELLLCFALSAHVTQAPYKGTVLEEWHRHVLIQQLMTCGKSHSNNPRRCCLLRCLEVSYPQPHSQVPQPQSTTAFQHLIPFCCTASSPRHRGPGNNWSIFSTHAKPCVRRASSFLNTLKIKQRFPSVIVCKTNTLAVILGAG